MKNFYDLLAIDIQIDIEICTGQGIIRRQWDLLEPLDLTCCEPLSVLVDGIEVLNFGYVENGTWCIQHDEPFYHWRHQITGQGWLLRPIKSSVH